MDFKDSQYWQFRILQHWRSRKYFCKIASESNFFFFNTWLSCNTIPFYISIVSYSADRRKFPQWEQVHKFTDVPNVHKMYTSGSVLSDSNKLWNLNFPSITETIFWMVSVMLGKFNWQYVELKKALKKTNKLLWCATTICFSNI